MYSLVFVMKYNVYIVTCHMNPELELVGWYIDKSFDHQITVAWSAHADYILYNDTQCDDCGKRCLAAKATYRHYASVCTKVYLQEICARYVHPTASLYVSLQISCSQWFDEELWNLFTVFSCAVCGPLVVMDGHFQTFIGQVNILIYQIVLWRIVVFVLVCLVPFSAIF